jgi:hypothetical protein
MQRVLPHPIFRLKFCPALFSTLNNPSIEKSLV